MMAPSPRTKASLASNGAQVLHVPAVKQSCTRSPCKMAASNISISDTTHKSEPAGSSPDPAEGPGRTLCATCSARVPVDSGYSCLDCLGSSKVINKLCQLLKEESSHVRPEEVRCCWVIFCHRPSRLARLHEFKTQHLSCKRVVAHFKC